MLIFIFFLSLSDLISSHSISIGIPVLIEKSLISVSRDQVLMHDLLQIMGKEIVRCESPEEPGRRSRLWTYEDVCLALMDNTVSS
jgi:hypothetical protein